MLITAGRHEEAIAIGALSLCAIRPTRLAKTLSAALAVALWPTLSLAADRSSLPLFFQDSYLALNAGFGAFGFTDANLALGLHSARILTDRPTVRVSAGHYFTPFVAVQLSLMRPILWVQYQGVYSANSSNSVWPTVLALTVRPMLPLGDRVRLYGDVGPAYFSRHGFTGPGGAAGLPSASGVTAMTGAGLLYRLGSHWNADAGAGLVWPAKGQPSAVYGAFGLAYRFGPLATVAEGRTSPSDWLMHEVDVGFFERRLLYWDIARGLSKSGIFFNGEIKTRRGETVFYEQNFYHGVRWISLNWGVSAARWVSAVNGETFYTLSVFPAVRVWPARTSLADVYLGYSLAGPSYLSRGVIDGRPTGGAFTFQDYIDVGALVGKTRRLKVSLRLVHYSNGNLRPDNPGVAPPVTLNTGYAW